MFQIHLKNFKIEFSSKAFEINRIISCHELMMHASKHTHTRKRIGKFKIIRQNVTQSYSINNSINSRCSHLIFNSNNSFHNLSRALEGFESRASKQIFLF